MNATVSLPAVANRLANLKGQFVGLSWKRDLKTYKGESRSVTKSVRSVVMVGASYDNRAVVQAAREDGTLPAENQGLNGKERVHFPTLLRSLKTGKLYLRAYPVRDEAGKPRSCKSIYRVNGARVSRDEAKTICLASEFSKGSPLECYDIALDNLTAVRLTRRSDAKVNYLGKA